MLAGVVNLGMWVLRRTLSNRCLGWWSHIVMDMFTHSADCYPSPVLYPFTQRGFDRHRWNAPWFLALNYSALLLTWLWILARPQR